MKNITILIYRRVPKKDVRDICYYDEYVSTYICICFYLTNGLYANNNWCIATYIAGLIVLRVAEVAQFQEKILRAILNGDLKDVVVTPQQIVFGTQILLRNSDIAGNMQLMIDNEMKKKDQKQARIVAANVMNALQKVSSTAAQIERELSPADYDELANLYRLVRVELNTLYELLPTMEKQKYDNYFVQVTEYEKKIAEGVYNPDIDGVLKFDYDK